MLRMRENNVLWIAVAALVLGGCCCPTPCCPDPCAVWRPTGGPTATGAATAKPTVSIKPSGFLDSYAGLRRSPSHEGSWVWMKEGLDLRVYDHLLIDPVEVILDAEGQKIVTEEMRQKASSAFREILFDTLDPYYEVVEEAGEHVLRVRLALTDLVPTPEMEEGKPPVQTGGAELEGIFSDAVTGETLMRVVSRIEGSAQGKEAKPEWQAVEGAFYEWADRLLTFLDSFKE
jgi:hypothetical protein